MKIRHTPACDFNRVVTIQKLIACFLVFALASPQIWADPSPQTGAPKTDAKHTNSIRKKVADCIDNQRKVTVETYDDRRLSGFISEAAADDFTLSYAGRTTTLSYADVKKIRWQSPVNRQIKVAIGATVVVAVIFGAFLLLGGLRD